MGETSSASTIGETFPISGQELTARMFPSRLFPKLLVFGLGFRHATEEPCLLNGGEVLRSIHSQLKKGEQLSRLPVHWGICSDRPEVMNRGLQVAVGGCKSRAGMQELRSANIVLQRGVRTIFPPLGIQKRPLSRNYS